MLRFDLRVVLRTTWVGVGLMCLSSPSMAQGVNFYDFDQVVIKGQKKQPSKQCTKPMCTKKARSKALSQPVKSPTIPKPNNTR